MSNQMKGIDWSKAPHGATHYRKDSALPWRMLEDGEWYCWEPDEENWIAISDPMPEQYLPIGDHPAAEWTGEGLPPVGTVCEAWHNGCAQGVVQVRYSGGCMVLWNVKLKYEQCSASENYTFKPIRTPEQIAAEEREKEVDALCSDILSHYEVPKMINYLGLAKALHAAGYRKVTP